MSDYDVALANRDRGTTLSSLKEQMYSLNMRMLLAIQNHDAEAQKEIKKQVAELQGEMDDIVSRCGHRTAATS